MKYASMNWILFSKSKIAYFLQGYFIIYNTMIASLICHGLCLLRPRFCFILCFIWQRFNPSYCSCHHEHTLSSSKKTFLFFLPFYVSWYTVYFYTTIRNIMYNETRFDVVDRFTPLNLILDQNVVYIKMLRNAKIIYYMIFC